MSYVRTTTRNQGVSQLDVKKIGYRMTERMTERKKERKKKKQNFEM